MENSKERLVLFLKLRGLSQGKFEKMAGLSNGYVNKLKANLTSNTIQRIVGAFPDLNPNWLMYGEGEMLKPANNATEDNSLEPSKDGTGIPLIPVDAMAGYFAGEQTVLLQECDRYVVPAFRNADFLIHVRGDSMMPHYYSGDMVACKMLSLVDIFFQWGKVYVINTDQGALIKKVEPGTTDESITLMSENEKYKPFEISRRSIYQIAIVIGVIRAE